MFESAICYAKKEPIECLAAALGIIGGCFYSSSDPMVRICSASMWCAGNLMWVVFAHNERKWALFGLQAAYFAQNLFAIGNLIFGWF